MAPALVSFDFLWLSEDRNTAHILLLGSCLLLGLYDWMSADTLTVMTRCLGLSSLSCSLTVCVFAGNACGAVGAVALILPLFVAPNVGTAAFASLVSATASEGVMVWLLNGSLSVGCWASTRALHRYFLDVTDWRVVIIWLENSGFLCKHTSGCSQPQVTVATLCYGCQMKCQSFLSTVLRVWFYSVCSLSSLNICIGQSCWRSLHLIILYTPRTFLNFYWLSHTGNLSALVWHAAYFIGVYPAHIPSGDFRIWACCLSSFAAEFVQYECVWLCRKMTQVIHSCSEPGLRFFFFLRLLKWPWQLPWMSW